MNTNRILQGLKGSFLFVIVSLVIFYAFSFFETPSVLVLSLSQDSENQKTEEFLGLVNRLNEISPDSLSGNPFDVDFLNSIEGTNYIEYSVSVPSTQPGRVNPFSLTSPSTRILENIEEPSISPEDEEEIPFLEFNF